jgi:uncharacterized membrane protein HdeD (DUF308 family)
VLRGALAVLFGLLALVWPGITVLALVLLWGAYALVDGVASLGVALFGHGEHRVVYGLLGVLGIVVGVITFAWPAITALALLVVIAVWALIAGVVQIAAAIRLRKVITNEWFLGISGALLVILGIVLIVQPATGAVGLVTAIGIFAIVWGIGLVMFGLRLRRLGSTVAHEGAQAA